MKSVCSLPPDKTHPGGSLQSRAQEPRSTLFAQSQRERSRSRAQQRHTVSSQVTNSLCLQESSPGALVPSLFSEKSFHPKRLPYPTFSLVSANPPCRPRIRGRLPSCESQSISKQHVYKRMHNSRTPRYVSARKRCGRKPKMPQIQSPLPIPASPRVSSALQDIY